MARILWVVLLLVLAVWTSAAQSGQVTATARGGFKYTGIEGEATGSISGQVDLSVEGTTELMIVLKDIGGITFEGLNEAIVFLKSVDRSKLTVNTLWVVGKGTFQGEARQIEVTLIDATKRNEKDSFMVRVIKDGRIEFEHSAKLDPRAITIVRKRQV